MKFAQFCSNIWSWIVDKFNWLRGTVGNVFSNLWVRLKDFQIFNKIGGAFVFVKDKLSGLFAPLLAKLSELGILGVITKWVGPVLSIVTLIPLVKQIIDGFKARKATKPTNITEAANLGDEKIKKALGKKFAKTAFANRADFAKNKKDERRMSADDVDAARKDLKESETSKGFERMFNDIKATSKDIIMEAAASNFGQFLIAEYNMTAEEAAKHVLFKQYKKARDEKKREKIISALGFDPATRQAEDDEEEVQVKTVKADKKAAKTVKAEKSSKKETNKKKTNKKKKKNKSLLDEFAEDDLAFADAVKDATEEQLLKLSDTFEEYGVKDMFHKMAQGKPLNNMERQMVTSISARYLSFADVIKERAQEKGYAY